MKNHFFFSYVGNKRDEVGIIHDKIKNKLDGIKTIVEPFCGSSAFSFFISTLYPKRFNYILNDNNENLVKLYHIAQNKNKFEKLVKQLKIILKDLNKEKYNVIIKSGGLIGYILSNYIFKIRAGLFPNTDHIKTIDAFENAPIIHFLRTENVVITNLDAVKVYEKFNSSSCLVFLDPPYVMLNNNYYTNATLNIYEYLNDHPILKMKAFIILVLEWSWIIKLLFKDTVRFLYDKKYQTSKKNTIHAIISNRSLK